MDLHAPTPTPIPTTTSQDDEGGLEVQRRADGAWIPAPSRRQEFMAAAGVNAASYPLIVNVGDMMMRWTNDVLRSTPHRVVRTVFMFMYVCVCTISLV